MNMLQAGDDSAEMHQRLKDLGVPIPTGPDAVPSLPSAPVPLGNIIPAPAMGMGQPYPLLPQIPVGPTEFLSVNGMVTAQVLADDEEYKEVGFRQSLRETVIRETKQAVTASQSATVHTVHQHDVKCCLMGMSAAITLTVIG